MAVTLLACSQKQLHPVPGALRAPSKYLLIDWQKDLLGPGKWGCWAELPDMMTWLVHRSLCLFASPWNSSDWSDLHKEVSNPAGPAIMNFLKGKWIGPFLEIHLQGDLYRWDSHTGRRKVELCSKYYALFCSRRHRPSSPPNLSTNFRTCERKE